eukprot:TRINITY_DN11041_c0_g1_i1.p1 TRINITY_DN11041_c0_g1~~TRINITY_DN11041_c0_g1_i1.p1  ORF type:complete len:679 (+),score=98.61 TRINITY_DN11041_c0_g1_i1:53-2038(+)
MEDGNTPRDPSTNPEMEAAWVKHQTRNNIPKEHESWVPYPEAGPGWNPWKLVPIQETIEKESEFKKICEFYYHMKLRGEETPPWVADRVENEEDSNEKREAQKKFFPESAALENLEGLCSDYNFEMGGFEIKPNAPILKKTKKQKKTVKTTQSQNNARKNWMKIAAHTKLTLLQDMILPHPAAGLCYASSLLYFAKSRNSFFVPFDYSTIDAQVPLDCPPTLLEAVDLISKPYQKISWRCNPSQQAHYTLRAYYIFLKKNFTATDSADISTPEEIYSAKSTNSEGLALLLCKMIDLTPADLKLSVKTVKGRRPGLVNTVGHPVDMQTACWNLAEWHGQKYLIDVHGSIKGDTELYWLCPPAVFYSQHCPDDPKMQLAATPGHASAWEVSPSLLAPFHENCLQLSSHVKYSHIHCKSPPLKIVFQVPDADIELTGKLYHGGLVDVYQSSEPPEEVQEGSHWLQRSTATSMATFSIVLPDTGLFTFELWVGQRKCKMKRAMSYQIASSVKIGDDPLFPSQKVSPFTAVLATPSQGKHIMGAPLVFTVYPTLSSVKGVVVVNIPRGGGPNTYTFLLYDSLTCCFTGHVLSPQRGTLNVFLRIDDTFVPAFMNFIIAAALNNKEDIGGDAPLICPPDKDELLAIRKRLNGGGARQSAEGVGGYFN